MKVSIPRVRRVFSLPTQDLIYYFVLCHSLLSFISVYVCRIPLRVCYMRHSRVLVHPLSSPTALDITQFDPIHVFYPTDQSNADSRFSRKNMLLLKSSQKKTLICTGHLRLLQIMGFTDDFLEMIQSKFLHQFVSWSVRHLIP